MPAKPISPTRPISAVDIEVARASLSGIVREMQHSLFRTGYSTIIRESQNASCALIDRDGDVIAQHVVLPLHLGAFPACCRAILSAYGNDIREGDGFLINHPYDGGSPHAPDMAVLTAAFHEGRHIGFCASIAHKGDIGGPVPGSCSGSARETYNEGLHLPAVRYQRGFEPYGDVERIIAANSRTPELVLGDIRGQLGADVPKLIEALKYSGGANWSLASWGKSTGKWAEKAMDVALEHAQEIKMPMPLAAHVDQLMKSIDQEKMKALLK